MQLKSLTLKNIRSYSDLTLEFKRGSTLLSGDIGSGKTTILFGIEFALFGLMKGMLSGGALLRHGSKEGSVKLTFEIEDNTQTKENKTKEITIFRALKRAGTAGSSITQDAGYIEIDKVRKDCTPVELKSIILLLLGYPDELLTKSKSLIFRYTVYTPQEEMKQIILDSEEDRLEKLTKIFNTDKYKRVKENAEMYARDLRSETKILPILEKELHELKETHKKYEQEMEDKNISLLKIQVQITTEEKIVLENEAKMKELEDSLKHNRELKQELNLVLVEQKNVKRNSDNTKTEILSLEKQKIRTLDEMKEDAKRENIEKNKKDGASKETRELTIIQDELTNYKDKKEETEKKIIEAKSKLGTIARRREESNEIKQKIGSLEKCPLCAQEVSADHKHNISIEEDKKLTDLAEKEVKLNELLEKASRNLEIIMKKIESLQLEIYSAKEQEQKIKFRKHQEQIIAETDKKITEKKEKLLEFEKEILIKTSKEKELIQKIEDTMIDDKLVEELSKKLKESKDAHLTLKVNEAGILQSIKENALNIENNETSQEKKTEQINIVLRKKMLEHWLTNHFVNLMDVIEKHVMASTHSEFKSYFEEWFNMLIEEESITATIDESFNPKVNQNGYDADIENLSGGEKTSVALAYKLALNKVINKMIGTIKTKDLIILDEPTDGFSSHQLDKVREVLDALHSSQTIIVSHESKMESFVDHIIRLRKHESESEIYN